MKLSINLTLLIISFKSKQQQLLEKMGKICHLGVIKYLQEGLVPKDIRADTVTLTGTKIPVTQDCIVLK